jgi:hypothetical protein
MKSVGGAGRVWVVRGEFGLFRGVQEVGGDCHWYVKSVGGMRGVWAVQGECGCYGERVGYLGECTLLPS